MLFDEEYAQTKLRYETRLQEAEHARLVAEAKQHNQQVLNDTAQLLRASYPSVSIFDLFGMLLRSKKHAI